MTQMSTTYQAPSTSDQYIVTYSCTKEVQDSIIVTACRTSL